MAYTTDEDLFSALDKDLGAKSKWNPGPIIDCGTLQCESQLIVPIEPTLQTRLQVNGNKS